ncbi:MAG TPA: hypothetical protein VHB45_12915 [Alloacidobacterium sp.]|nr:hypothetical protein [Alloacidobacterium sp.]
MPKMRTYSRSFAGGELSPEMFGRIDDGRFQTGAARMRNFIATPQGPAENRPGFAFVKATKNNGAARLISFVYNATQTMVIELGDSYIRFHTQGATLLYDANQRAFIPTATVTVSVASPCVVTWANHGLEAGDTVGFSISSGGSLPTGIAAAIAYQVQVIDANTFHILDPVSGAAINVTAAGSGTITGYRWYAAGDLVAYHGTVYYRTTYMEGSSGDDPSATPEMWYPEPADLTYEIPSPYAAADLFDVHYVQSADVMTLVHPSYAPAELSRASATVWMLRTIAFGPQITPPATVAVTDSPGFKVGIYSISTGNPAIITTSSNHTLVLGDGVYVKGLTAVIAGVDTPLDGFYMVNLIPKDDNGQDILNELQLMDYNGVVLSSAGWSSWHGPATIQYGTKIFNIDDTYVVTALSADQVSESQVSAAVDVINNLNVQGAYNVITWSAVPGASRYHVYKKLNGLYGYIGETSDLTFSDDNIAPDMSITPPIYDDVLTGAGNYPGAVAYFGQRRVFAGSLNQPQNVWMTKVGTESDFSYALPTEDSDRIAIRVSQLQSDRVLHVLPLANLLMLTSGAEIRVSAVNSEALTPSTISALPQSYIGANSVQPQAVNNVAVFCAARGGHVREIGYSWQSDSYVTGDLSLRAAHLFDNLSILDMAYMKAPRPILWFISSNGNLLGLTYIPEEQIGSWHRHDTDGVFESVACVSEGSEDRLYAVVRRVINGNTVRYVERMASRLFEAQADAFFVDAGTTWSGVNTSDVTLTVTEGAVYGSTTLKPYVVTASADAFAATDVGDVLTFTYVAGTLDDGTPNMVMAKVTVSEFVSATVVQSMPIQLPTPDPLAGQTFAGANWGWKRKKLSGLTWLEGKTVSILGDGAVYPQAVVTNGAISLQYPAQTIQVGLPYTSDLRTLPLILQVDGAGQGMQKNINRVWLKLWRSGGIFIGPDENTLIELKQRTTENYGQPPALKGQDDDAEEVDMRTVPMWQSSGQVFVRQNDPLPLSIVGLTLEVVLGD